MGYSFFSGVQESLNIIEIITLFSYADSKKKKSYTKTSVKLLE